MKADTEIHNQILGVAQETPTEEGKDNCRAREV